MVELVEYTETPNECDTNSDTFLLGNNFCVISYTSCTAGFYSYENSFLSIENFLTVMVATSYE